MIPAVQWDDLMAIEWATADNRVLYVDLAQVSHISSWPVDGQEPDDKTQDDAYRDDGDKGSPDDKLGASLSRALSKPARLHLKNGDEHPLAMTYGQATGRLRTARRMLLDRLNQNFGARDNGQPV